MKPRRFSAQAITVLLVVLIAEPVWLFAVTPGPELPNPGQVSLTRQQQEQLGLKAAGEVYQQMPVLPDSSPVTQYVQRLGAKLVKVIPSRYSWPYQFHVVQQKEINAFALPGGPIFVNVGTITAAGNEAELVGVMAHEMSHVYMQHSAKQMTKNTVPSLLAGIGQIAGAMIGGVGGAIASVGGQLGGGLLSMKYSRADEAQADAVGAIIMWKAGYDPRAMAEFFQKLESQGGSGPQFLSDHPNPGNRVEAVDKEIQDWPHKNLQENSPEFAQIKQEASRVKAYDAQQIANGAKQGTWARQNRENHAIPADLPTSSVTPDQNGQAPSGDVSNVSYQQVRPSGNFKQLQQAGFSISYPDNWQVFSGSDNGITIAPPAGVSQNAVAYGAVIGAGQDQNAGDLDTVTRDLIQSLQQSNPNLRLYSSPQAIRINGITGRSTLLTGTSPVQQNGRSVQERDWLITVPRSQGGFLYLVLISPENSFDQLRPTFQHMLDSLQVS